MSLEGQIQVRLAVLIRTPCVCVERLHRPRGSDVEDMSDVQDFTRIMILISCDSCCSQQIGIHGLGYEFLVGADHS